jgi:hypothetical protein
MDDQRPDLRPVQPGDQEIRSPAADQFAQLVQQATASDASWRAQEIEDQRALAITRQRATHETWRLVRATMIAFGFGLGMALAVCGVARWLGGRREGSS